MLALIEYCPQAEPVLAVKPRKAKRAIAQNSSYVISESGFMGLRCYHISVPSEEEAFRLSRELADRRIDCIALKDGFPYPQYFAGAAKPDESAVFRAMIPEIIRRYSRHGNTVLFLGADQNNELLKLAASLNKTVICDCGRAAAQKLLTEYGASVIPYSPGTDLSNTNLALLFRSPENIIVLPSQAAVICCEMKMLVNVRGGNIISGVVTAAKGAVPQGYPRDGLIGEALKRGALSPEDLPLMKILEQQK